MCSNMKSNGKEICQRSPQSGNSQQDKGNEVYSESGVNSDTPAATPSRISKKQLQEVMGRLGLLDWEILQTIRECNVILGKQIGRLFFADRGPRATAVATSRKLQTLVKYGLITSTTETPRTNHRGRLAKIYHLTEAGERCLQIHLGEPEGRKRMLEPSRPMLTHSLSVTECAVQTTEACSADDMRLISLAHEPNCWFPYRSRGKSYILKPDLAIVTKKQDWLDHNEEWYSLWWFIEIDLSSESVQVILDKCRRYYDFYHSNEARDFPDGIFPLVVWVVKTEARKQLLIRRIREAFPKSPRIFAVILDTEYTRLLRDEMDMEDCLCPY